MTAQEIINYVRSIIISPVTGYLTDEEILSWINDGLRMFYQRKGVPDVWYWDVAANTTEVPFDNRVIRLAKLSFSTTTNESDATIIDNDDFEIFNNTIYFKQPIPQDGRLWAWGYREPNYVANATDVVDIPKLYESAIKSYVLGIAYLKDENYAMSQYQLGIFLQQRDYYFSQDRQINVRKKVMIEKKI